MPAEIMTAPDQSRELWLAIPKGGKTLGGSDDAFLSSAGFTAEEKNPRVDDYRLTDGPEFKDAQLRAWVKRPKDALRDIADGFMDVAVVGRDVLDDFNKSLSKDEPGLMEIVDLNMATCILALAVRENSGITSLNAFNGAAMGSKFDSTTLDWLNKKGIQPGKIIYRDGGMESLMRQSQDILGITDIIETGASLVANGLIPFGMKPQDWEQVKAGMRLVDLPMSTLGRLPGLIKVSSALLVRTPQTLSPQKEAAIQTLAQRFYNAAQAQDRKPRLKIRIEQPARPALRPESVEGYGPHSWVHQPSIH